MAEGRQSKGRSAASATKAAGRGSVARTSAKRGRAKAPAKKTKRIRRTAEDAHELILDAADRRLAESGPRGIRLQEIAADIGISHPTILHHFGSREALVEAVVTRALESLQQRILERIASQEFGAAHANDLFRQIMATLGDRGGARLMAWLALEGRTTHDPANMIRALAAAMHERRVAETKTRKPFDDTLFLVLLIALALFGEGVLGDPMMQSAGLSPDAQSRENFHGWLVKLIEQHLQG